MPDPSYLFAALILVVIPLVAVVFLIVGGRMALVEDRPYDWEVDGI